MQKAILGILAILAVAGWAAAYVVYGESQDLTGKLEASQGERAKLEAALEDAKKDLEAHIASAGSVQDIDHRLKAAESRAAEIEAQTRAKQQELISADKEIEARKLELSKLERDLNERTAALRAAEDKTGAAEREVGRLQAEIADLQSTAERAKRGISAEPPVAALVDIPKTPEGEPKPATTAMAPSAEPEAPTEKLSRSEQLFKLLDKNGDGAIDEFEFRLNSVRLLGAIDQNGDGVVTIDETRLTPEKFALFDGNGDGKISSIEFVEAFRILDRDAKGTITLEDYQHFIETAAK